MKYSNAVLIAAVAQFLYTANAITIPQNGVKTVAEDALKVGAGVIPTAIPKRDFTVDKSPEDFSSDSIPPEILNSIPEGLFPSDESKEKRGDLSILSDIISPKDILSDDNILASNSLEINIDPSISIPSLSIPSLAPKKEKRDAGLLSGLLGSESYSISGSNVASSNDVDMTNNVDLSWKNNNKKDKRDFTVITKPSDPLCESNEKRDLNIITNPSHPCAPKNKRDLGILSDILSPSHLISGSNIGSSNDVKLSWKNKDQEDKNKRDLIDLKISPSVDAESIKLQKGAIPTGFPKEKRAFIGIDVSPDVDIKSVDLESKVIPTGLPKEKRAFIDIDVTPDIDVKSIDLESKAVPTGIPSKRGFIDVDISPSVGVDSAKLPSGLLPKGKRGFIDVDVSPTVDIKSVELKNAAVPTGIPLDKRNFLAKLIPAGIVSEFPSSIPSSYPTDAAGFASLLS